MKAGVTIAAVTVTVTLTVCTMPPQAPVTAIRYTPGVVAAVVVIVSVAVAALASVMITGLDEPNVKEGASWTPPGINSKAGVRVTEPVKPLSGVTVIVEVFPAVDPAEKVRLVED